MGTQTFLPVHLIKLCVCLHLCFCEYILCMCRCLQRPEEVGSPEMELQGVVSLSPLEELQELLISEPCLQSFQPIKHFFKN